ncbi:hypothetical protein HY486_01955 [Candidatus Woesearchaeota archaeon]|nr:hypothetical protein [Candidatus Woesearchaeota archaeon]
MVGAGVLITHEEASGVVERFALTYWQEGWIHAGITKLRNIPDVVLTDNETLDSFCIQVCYIPSLPPDAEQIQDFEGMRVFYMPHNGRPKPL